MKIGREIGSTIVKGAVLIASCLQSGRKLLLFGNGGSAADAQHLAAEFVGRFAMERGGLPAIALTTDSSILTAVGNGYGFQQVFPGRLRHWAVLTISQSASVPAAIQQMSLLV